MSAADPFGLPLRALDRLRSYAPDRSFDDPVHTAGVVTAIWPGKAVFLTDGKQSVGLPTAADIPLRVGDRVEVVGFPSLGDSIHTLQDPIFRPAQQTVSIVEAKEVTATAALTGVHEAELVRMEGRLVTREWVAGHYTLLVEGAATSGDPARALVFSAILPSAAPIPAVEALADDSKVRLTGICITRDTEPVRQFPVSRSVQLLLRDERDVDVVARPPWWTMGKLMWGLGLTLGLAGGALAWAATLRRQVRRQTAQIQEQLYE